MGARLKSVGLGMAALVAMTQIAATSCGGKDPESFVPNVDAEHRTPTMATTDVDTYISDSGYTRYRVVADTWLIFDEGNDPYWLFPDGMHLEQFDLAMKPQADVTCLKATYYSQRRLWQLDGDVVMVNTARDSFLTQQLFWDQASRTFHTDSFVHIVRTDHTIEGYGMVSNENLSAYTINRTTAILPANRLPGGRDSESSAAPDSAGAAPVRTRAAASAARAAAPDPAPAPEAAPEPKPQPVRVSKRIPHPKD